MAVLSDSIRATIVVELALRRSSKQIIQKVKEEHGVVVERKQLQKYQPFRRGKPPAKKWRDLFASVRADFDRSVKDIPIASQAFRVREADELYESARDSKNLVLASRFLEIGAKEIGGSFDRRRKTAEDRLDELLRNELLEAEALAGRKLEAIRQLAQLLELTPADIAKALLTDAEGKLDLFGERPNELREHFERELHRPQLPTGSNDGGVFHREPQFAPNLPKTFPTH